MGIVLRLWKSSENKNVILVELMINRRGGNENESV
jgi:hypothetical protein